MRRALGLLVVSLLGCPGKQADPGEVEGAGKPTVSAESKRPDDEASVLAELAPMPDGPVELRYRITGPGGLVGELVVLQKPGGWRSERWTMTTGEGQLEVSGRTIATPRVLWSATGEQPGEQSEARLGALADAWLALPVERQDAALTHLRAWRAELAKSRLEAPGEVETIQGIGCVKMRIAAQNLCLWEAPGLLMRYEGAAFELLVTSVTRNPSVPDGEFELPAQAKDAKRVPVEPIDAKALIEGLADGKVGPLATELTRVNAPRVAAP